MSNEVHVRGEGGACFVLALPLHEAIEEQLVKGTLTVTEPDDCGHTAATETVPAKKTAAKKA